MTTNGVYTMDLYSSETLFYFRTNNSRTVNNDPRTNVYCDGSVVDNDCVLPFDDALSRCSNSDICLGVTRYTSDDDYFKQIILLPYSSIQTSSCDNCLSYIKSFKEPTSTVIYVPTLGIPSQESISSISCFNESLYTDECVLPTDEAFTACSADSKCLGLAQPRTTGNNEWLLYGPPGTLESNNYWTTLQKTTIEVGQPFFPAISESKPNSFIGSCPTTDIAGYCAFDNAEEAFSTCGTMTDCLSIGYDKLNNYYYLSSTTSSTPNSDWIHYLKSQLQ